MGHISDASKMFEFTGMDVGNTQQTAHRVYLDEVSFTREAMYTLGLAVKEVAERVGVFPREIIKKLKGHMYWDERTENLFIVFPVPEIEADMMVEIPRDHWWFKDAGGPTQ